MPKTKITSREDWLNAFIRLARPQCEAVGFPVPTKVRASVGFTSKGLKGKRIGECWSKDCSDDAAFEIFITPSLQSSAARVADILTHELVHAAVGLADGHGKQFRKCATALGLQGKMTATTAGPLWHQWADPLLKKLGPLPGADLRGGSSSGPKKQTTRMIKLSCECGWTCRTARSNIEDDMQCPLPGCRGELREG